MSKKESKFKGKVGEDARNQSERGSSYGYMNLPKGMKTFKAPPGKKVMLDFIPYEIISEDDPNLKAVKGLEIGDPWYRLGFKVHKNVGEEKENIICPRTFGDKCPICENREHLQKQGKSTKEEIKSLYPSYRSLYAVIPIDVKDYDDEVIYIWDMSDYLFLDLLIDELKEQDKYEIFPDPEEGYSMKIRFDSETFGDSKPFAKAKRIDFEDREEQYNEDIIQEVPNFMDLLNVLPYKEIEKLFYEYEDEDLEKEKPARSSRRSKDDEEKEDEKPSRKSRKPEKKEPLEEIEGGLPELKEGEQYCNACEGTMKNSRGKDCPICDATGIIDIPEEEKEKEEKPKRRGRTPKEDEKPEKPSRRRTSKEEEKEEKPSRRRTAKEPEGECPNNYEFGKDFDREKECDACDSWDACAEEHDAKK